MQITESYNACFVSDPSFSLSIYLSLSFAIHQFLLEETNPYRRILRIPCCHPRVQKITTENSYDRRPRAKKVRDRKEGGKKAPRQVIRREEEARKEKDTFFRL